MYHSRFKGEHYQIGFKWGRNLLKHKQLFLTNVPFEITLEHYDFALQCLPIYQKFFPEIIEEIRGIADGQKCSFKSICAVLLSMFQKYIVLVLLLEMKMKSYLDEIVIF